MIQEVDVSHMADFLDGYNQAVKISYDSGSEEFFIYLVDPSQP